MASVNGITPPRGLPMLSGPPPVVESSLCRQCAKQFNPIWRRAHACGHCGYEYCSNCLSDGQALMPRRAGQPSSSINSGPLTAIREELGIGERRSMNGYEVESVCLHCLGMLQVTSAPLQLLRSLPLKRLKEYLAAYNVECVGPKEKEDFVQAVIKARNPATGSLAPEAESYYRRRSVPRNGQIPQTNSSRPSPAPRPPPTNVRPAPHDYTQARPSPSSQYRPPPPSQQSQYRPPPPQARPPPARPLAQARQSPARPPPARPPQPAPPVPTLLSLVSLPKSYLSSLSIGTLKAFLYENHVKVDFKQVLEKEELIDRVSELVAHERKRLERQRIEEDRLANGVAGGDTPPSEGEEGQSQSTEDKGRVPTGPPPEIERGLCVVCQDEEATLAAVDCGHLAMCAHCSDLIMATSQECPLCRTRIHTPQRLIRIYRV